jgi:hypothetical protein
LESLSIEKGLEKDSRHITRDVLDVEVAKLERYDETTAQLRASLLILKSLFFRGMDARHSLIADAHSETFDWIFKSSAFPPSDPRSRVKFDEWLAWGSGIYWISGKPGSGKSTLMKYLHGSEGTRRHLASWAGSSQLIIAGYFFWLSGSQMEKSQEGLLRQLLFEIMQSHPDWIPTLSPKRWYATNTADLPMDVPWSLSELLAAISKLDNIPACPSGATKICVFIDGLDEYYGDHLELIRTIRTISKLKDIKLCVSSRPWNCFEDAFGHDTSHKLYLEDLTKDDIANYARDMLSQLQAPLFDNKGAHIEELVSEIVCRAQGVFLWVFLVVRSLRDGIINGDPLTLLQDRLRELPTDLEEFFERIIQSVDKVYRRRMAHTFQVALYSDQPLRLLLYSFLDEEQPRRPLAYGQPYDKIRYSVSSEESRMHRSLNGRYRGLLETAGLLGYKEVHFLHRTVRDFLATRKMQDLLISYCEVDFNPFRCVCKAFISQERFYPGSINLSQSTTAEQMERYPERINLDQLDIFLQFAHRLGDESILLVEEMNSALYSIRPAYQEAVVVQEGRATNLFGRAMELGLTPYVLQKLSGRTGISETEGAGALACALSFWICGFGAAGRRDIAAAKASADITTALLEIGAQGSWPCNGKLPLRRLTDNLPLDDVRKLLPEIRQYWLRTVYQLCGHGARIQDCLPWKQINYRYDYFGNLVNLIFELKPQESLGELLPALFQTARPSKIAEGLSGVVTDDLWSKTLLHIYISRPLSPSSGTDRRQATFFAHIANLFLSNGASPHKSLIGELPREMEKELENLILLKHSPFRSSGYVLVPEALNAIFAEGFPERQVILTSLERATQKGISQAADFLFESKDQKSGQYTDSISSAKPSITSSTTVTSRSCNSVRRGTREKRTRLSLTHSQIRRTRREGQDEVVGRLGEGFPSRGRTQRAKLRHKSRGRTAVMTTVV